MLAYLRAQEKQEDASPGKPGERAARSVRACRKAWWREPDPARRPGSLAGRPARAVGLATEPPGPVSRGRRHQLLVGGGGQRDDAAGLPVPLAQARAAIAPLGPGQVVALAAHCMRPVRTLVDPDPFDVSNRLIERGGRAVLHGHRRAQRRDRPVPLRACAPRTRWRVHHLARIADPGRLRRDRRAQPVALCARGPGRTAGIRAARTDRRQRLVDPSAACHDPAPAAVDRRVALPKPA